MGLLPGPGGMVSDAELGADPHFDDPELATAVSAALAGDWHSAAATTATTGVKWNAAPFAPRRTQTRGKPEGPLGERRIRGGLQLTAARSAPRSARR